jgi:hypothetical protein
VRVQTQHEEERQMMGIPERLETLQPERTHRQEATLSIGAGLEQKNKVGREGMTHLVPDLLVGSGIHQQHDQ